MIISMSYGKILLVRAITFLIVTSYNYTLPNRFTLTETKDGAYYLKMNNSNGQTYWVQTKNTTDQDVFLRKLPFADFLRKRFI